MTADFLEIETQISRRFREDSVTDILVASLLKVAGGDATLFTPPEVKTGGDFDLVIHQPSSGEAIQYRVQSKRVVPHSQYWAWGSYRELDHPHGSGKQAVRLLRSSAREMIPTIPLYAFYNPVSVCEASGNMITGIQLADGRAVNSIVRALVRAKFEGKRPRWKRIEYLRHLFFPLSTILCSPVDDPTGKGAVIRPDVSRKAVLAAMKERRTAFRHVEDGPTDLPSELTYLSIPQDASQAKRAYIRPSTQFRSQEGGGTPRLIERATGRQLGEPAIQRARIKRLKLVLLSR